MIWVYILLATVISYLLCRKECKRPEYFILMFFPIELYGLNVASVTVKPYMIFGAVVIFFYFFIKRCFYIKKIILIFAFLLFFADLLTGLILSSVMQHLMFILNLMIASCVLSLSDDGIDLHSLSKVAIATLIGHGIVFLVLAVLFNMNNAFPDLLAYERNETGVFISLANATQEEIRMRGFTIDPNGFVVNYVFGGASALYYALSNKGSRIKNLTALILFVFIIIESGSRMGLLCFAALIVFSVLYIVTARKVNRNVIVVTGLVVFAVIIYAVLNLNSLTAFFNSYFNDRASLSSDKGRFTIWVSNMDYLIRTGKIWFGVGQDQIARLGDLNTAFHNTWLEWIGGCGIFIGGFISLWFLIIAVRAIGKMRYYKHNLPIAVPFVFGYVGTLLCISSISNIANITYIFLAFLINYHLLNLNCVGDTDEHKGIRKKQQISV